MLLRLLAGLPKLTTSLLQNALAVPAKTTRRITPPTAAAARLTARFVRAGAREAMSSAAEVSASAGQFGRVAGNAMTPQVGRWRAGSRMHLGLRHPADAHAPTAERLEAAARKVAVELAKHPDVLLAYWDAGLESLVVKTVEDTVGERVADRASELAAKHGLEHVGGQTPAHTHPGDVRNVRVNVAALALDAAGIATAVSGRAAFPPRAAETLVASVSLLREDPRVRAVLSRVLGSDASDLLLGAAHAAVCGVGQSPGPLLLDAAVRTTQLVRSLAQLATFEAVHDMLCAPDRMTVAKDSTERPPLRTSPGESYSDTAVNGMVGGALATLLFTRSLDKAAETVLAGVPKAARFGPDVFTAGLATALAREDMLIGDPARLRRLELVDTVVLHSGALRSTRRTVLEVHPSSTGWDHRRLWHAAMRTLSAHETGAKPTDEPRLELRPVPDETRPEAGLMAASVRGKDVGTVLVGWEADPMAEAALDAARRAGLHVVVVDEHGLGEFGTLADQLTSGERPFAETVAGLQEEGRTVLTVARVPQDRTPTQSERAPSARDVVDGLLRGDLAVAVTDEGSGVVWAADLLSLRGLEGVWRLLSAVPMSQVVSGWGRFFAQAGPRSPSCWCSLGRHGPSRGPHPSKYV